MSRMRDFEEYVARGKHLGDLFYRLQGFRTLSERELRDALEEVDDTLGHVVDLLLPNPPTPAAYLPNVAMSIGAASNHGAWVQEKDRWGTTWTAISATNLCYRPKALWMFHEDLSSLSLRTLRIGNLTQLSANPDLAMPCEMFRAPIELQNLASYLEMDDSWRATDLWNHPQDWMAKLMLTPKNNAPQIATELRQFALDTMYPGCQLRLTVRGETPPRVVLLGLTEKESRRRGLQR